MHTTLYKSGLVLALHIKFSYEYDLILWMTWGPSGHGKCENDMMCGAIIKTPAKRAILSGSLKVNCPEDVINFVKDRPCVVKKFYEIISPIQLAFDVKSNEIIRDNISAYSFKGIRDDTYMLKLDTSFLRKRSRFPQCMTVHTKSRICHDDLELPWQAVNILINPSWLKKKQWTN